MSYLDSLQRKDNMKTEHLWILELKEMINNISLSDNSTSIVNLQSEIDVLLDLNNQKSQEINILKDLVNALANKLIDLEKRI